MHGYYYQTVMEKNIIYDFGNDFCFQNEELSLQFNWTGGFFHM